MCFYLTESIGQCEVITKNVADCAMELEGIDEKVSYVLAVVAVVIILSILTQPLCFSASKSRFMHGCSEAI